MMNRRAALVTMGAGVLGTAFTSCAQIRGNPQAVSAQPMRWHAARRGMSFGIALLGPEMHDSQSRALIAREAELIQPINALKWGVVEPRRGSPDFGIARKIIDDAEACRLRVRGHAGFWYRSEPSWAAAALAGPGAGEVVLRRVSTAVAAFRGRIAEWDVVNEVVLAQDGLPAGLRRAPFGRPVDAGLYAECFHAAHEADPAARLFYNETEIEGDTPRESAQRCAALSLLCDLRKRGAPIHGFGVEGHLATHRRFSAQIFRRFLREVAGLGLVIRVTEFDVADNRAAGSPAERDMAVSDCASRFLDSAFDERAVEGLTIWGLRNRESWLQLMNWAKRADGALLRPLPFDDDFRRTPLWTAIARAFDNAPQR